MPKLGCSREESRAAPRSGGYTQRRCAGGARGWVGRVQMSGALHGPSAPHVACTGPAPPAACGAEGYTRGRGPLSGKPKMPERDKGIGLRARPGGLTLWGVRCCREQRERRSQDVWVVWGTRCEMYRQAAGARRPTAVAAAVQACPRSGSGPHSRRWKALSLVMYDTCSSAERKCIFNG